MPSLTWTARSGWNLFFILAVLGLVPFAAMAQNGIHIPTDSLYYLPLPKPFRDAGLYVQAGLAQPMGNFGARPERKATVWAPFADSTGMGAQQGYSFEMGYRRGFVSKRDKPSRIFPFWGVAVQGTYNPIDWSGTGGRWKQQKETSLIRGVAMPQLGIAFKHNAKWVLECHGGVMVPVYTTFPEIRIGGSNGSPLDFSLSPESAGRQDMPAFTAGIAWRTRHFRIAGSWIMEQHQVSYTYIEPAADLKYTRDSHFTVQMFCAQIGVQF